MPAGNKKKKVKAETENLRLRNKTKREISDPRYFKS